MNGCTSSGESYIFGMYKNGVVTTAFGKYKDVELPFVFKGEVLLKISSDEPSVFFDHMVFNTYVISHEENVTVLYHPKKLVFTRKWLPMNKIYQVAVVSETRRYIMVEQLSERYFAGIYSKGMVHITGMCISKPVNSRNSPRSPDMDEVGSCCTEEGSGKDDSHPGVHDLDSIVNRSFRCIFKRNHAENDPIVARMIGWGDRIVFYEVSRRLQEVEGLVSRTNPFIIVDGNTSVLVTEKNSALRVGDRVKVRILSEIYGRYLGTFRTLSLKKGMIRKALVTKSTYSNTYLDIDGMKGYLKKGEGKVSGKYIEGIISDVNGDRFELSRDMFLKHKRECELENGAVSIPFE